MKLKRISQAHQENWLLPGATKDSQSITADWQSTQQQPIAGVKLKQVVNVTKENGFLTEVFRHDWELDPYGVQQVFQVSLLANKISAWHAHQHTTDRIFANRGFLKVVLYDARKESKTFGQINEFRVGLVRPAMILIPPKVWHGVQNLSSEVSSLLNVVDRAYSYEDPDHWRLPWNSPQIPYNFTASEAPELSSL